MGAIITFGTSLVLLAGFLALKVWEQTSGRVLGSEFRRTLDAWVLRCTRAAVDAPPKLSELCLCALRGGVAHARVVIPHLFSVVRARVERAIEHFRARRLSKPHAERGEASEFLKNVSEHKNGIRNGNSQ